MSKLPFGWFTDQNIKEYRRLVEQVPDNGVICELGCGFGRSLCSVADIVIRKKIKVVVVDTFEGTESEHWAGQNFRKEFEDNIKRFGITDIIIKQATTDDISTPGAWGVFGDAKTAIIPNFDLLFIDADHSYQQVKKDIERWYPTVKKTGTIAGHDYSMNWPGVVLAVQEKFGKPKVVGDIWSHKENNILAYVSTLDRYDTLPHTLISIAFQTLKPDHLIIFDDNEQPKDLRQIEIYRYCFSLLEDKGITWEIIWGAKKGQHYNHEAANQMKNFQFAWRIDDDEAAETNVLEELKKEMKDGVGAVAGLVIPPCAQDLPDDYKLGDVGGWPLYQWTKWNGNPVEVKDLYSSFLYRTNIAHYDLRLSHVAHREETLFTHSLYKAGYKLIVTPKATTWHFKNSSGGIRKYPEACFYYDEQIFQEFLGNPHEKLIVLNNALGDHYAFRKIISEVIKKHGKLAVACCYPKVFEGFDVKILSIADALQITGGNIHEYDIYKKMVDWNWKQPLSEAFKKMYL